MTVEEKLIFIAENEQRVFEAGKAQRDYEWWDRYQKQNHGTPYEKARANYLYAFAGTGWDDTTYNPIRPIKPNENGNGQNIFSYSRITDTKVDVDLAHGGTMANCVNAFANATALVTIPKLIVDEYTVMSNQLTNCSKLQNLTIEGTIAKNAYFHWCPLTKESILSAFAALSDTATGVTAQFKTSAVNTAFETSEGAGDGSTSTEWQALVDSKPNWTIALTEP